MRYDLLADQLRKYPERYLWFGPYWWTVKRALAAAGFHFGHDDDPYARSQMEAEGSEPIREAMQMFRDNAGGFRNHDFTLPDGTPYFLHDDEMTAFSQL